MTRRTPHDQRGVSLILVLVTLVIFGLIVPVLGQFGSTNGVSGYVLKGNRFDRYAAEAGMQAAINWAQGQRQAGRQGTSCPDITTDTANGGGPNAARTVTVDCAGFDGRGLPAATVSMPAYALMARGTDGQAIHVTGNGTGTVRTSGAWWSEGGIKVDGPHLDAATDYVGAKRPCTGFTASPLDCPSRRVETLPSMPVAIPDDIPVDRPGPRDPCDAIDADGVVTIPSGLHWQRSFFDRIGDGRCDRGPVTIRLADDGPHVFDFSFYDDGSDTDWKINPSDRDPVSVESARGTGATCAGSSSPVLFAKDFTLHVERNASVDVCGASEAEQSVSVAQVMPHPGSEPVFRDSPYTVPSGWTVDDDNGTFEFPPSSPTTPATLLAGIDCQPDRDCAGGFVQGQLHGDEAEGDVILAVPDPVPATIGAKVDRLEVVISHHEESGSDIADRRLWISGGLPTQLTPRCALTRSDHRLDDADRWSTDTYTCDLSDVPMPYFPTGSLQIMYQVTLDNQGQNDPEPRANLSIDALRVRAHYAEPTARASNADTHMLDVDAGAVFHASGTVYLPTGDMTVEFGAAAAATFGRGVIVRRIDLRNPPAEPAFTPFSLPDGGDYTDRIATFRAFLGGDKSKPPVLTARVQFCDEHTHGTEVPNVTPPCVGIAGGPAKILAWDPTR